MASRAVNNIRYSKDDMKKIYRDQARLQVGGVRIKDIIEIIKILIPIIPPFFKAQISADANCYNGSRMGYACEDAMSYNSSGRCGYGMTSDDAMVGSGRYDHGMSYGNVRGRGNGHYEIPHADHYGDRIISEEEFDRLLEYAEECNVKMY